MSEVGLGLQSDKSTNEYVALARRAEAAGFDVISVFHDLLFQPAIYPLLVIAGATERIRIGPAALNPATLHPVELAGQAAALDLASEGRAYLGIAAGAWLDRLGLDESRPVQRMREAVEIVKRLQVGDRSGFAGEIFTLAPGAGFEYEPFRPYVPLMIGTWKPRMAAFAGEVADELKIGGCANPDMVRLMRTWIGNDDVGSSSAPSRSSTRTATLRGRGPPIRSRCTWRSCGRARPDRSAPGPPPLDRFVFAGTPEEVAAHAQTLFDAGVKRVEFGTPQGLTTARGVELLCDRVLPLLRPAMVAGDLA